MIEQNNNKGGYARSGRVAIWTPESGFLSLPCSNHDTPMLVLLTAMLCHAWAMARCLVSDTTALKTAKLFSQAAVKMYPEICLK